MVFPKGFLNFSSGFLTPSCTYNFSMVRLMLGRFEVHNVSVIYKTWRKSPFKGGVFGALLY